MGKGLILKVAGLTAIVGGLVFANQMVNASQAAKSPTTPATHQAEATVHDHMSMPAESETTSTPADKPRPGAGAGLLPAPARRVVGLTEGGPNFVSVCRYSHSSQDDPIVFPNKPGAAHHHDFFANTTTDAKSTYKSLRAGGSTCQIEGDTAAYWAPALWDEGKLVQPTLARIYYLPGRKDHTTIRPFPAGLKILAKDKGVRVTWSCVGKGEQGMHQTSIPTCSKGTHLVEHIRFPDCWNGKDLDSSDHMSHMAFAVRRGCPASHPVAVPAISMNIHYPTDGGSNVVLGMPDEPVSAHADFFNAWDQMTLDRLVRTCLDAGLHCGANPPLT